MINYNKHLKYTIYARKRIKFQKKKMNIDQEYQTLGDRMKEYEKSSESIAKIAPYLPYIVRLDGRSFSKFTSGFHKPFDSTFMYAMIMTMNDLISEFSPKTGYTHSDEITLIFSPCCTLEDYNTKTSSSTHNYNGRVVKLCSVYAGYASARFNFHINKVISTESGHYKENLINKVKECRACFDCRVLVFPYDKPQEIVNHMIWRSVYDCHRNAVQSYAYHQFSHKQIMNKNTSEMIEMLREKEILWENIPISHKHGVYAKRELYKIGQDGNECIRSKIVNRCFRITYTPEFATLMTDKYWPTDSTLTPLVSV